MTNKIGEHYVDSDEQRVEPAESENGRYHLLANRFGDTWTIVQEMPEADNTDDFEAFRETFTDFLEEVEALKLAGYEFKESNPEVAFWEKEDDR